MDNFQKNAISEKMKGNDIFHQGFALMGYLKGDVNDNNFIKRFGYYLINAVYKNDVWEVAFCFQAINNTPHIYNSHEIDTTDVYYKEVKDVCLTIAQLENSMFKYLTTEKILGIHFDDMPQDFKRKVKIRGI